jgi:ankyrin repeat protein
VHLKRKLISRRFRWVSCQIDALERCLEQRSLEKALVSLPETLDETYSRILDSISGENKQSAVRILQLLTYSEQPLSVAEVVDAIAVDITEKPHFDPKYRMPDPDEILVYCSSLVVMVPMWVDFDDRVTYEEYSDEDSEKDDNSDNIHTNGKHASGKPMEATMVLQLAHFSVKEYLISGRFRGPLSSELHETTARVSVAMVCLSYLLQFDRCLSHRKIVARFPFAKYCAVSWLHHATGVESESSQLMGLIKEFFCYNQAGYRVCYRLYCPDTSSEFSWQYKGTTQPAPPLYYAALGNLYTIVKFLLDNGADVNAKGGFQSYALLVASKQGHEEIVQLLIERDADVNAVNPRRHNALMEASSSGHTRIVKLLLERGVDVNARGALGRNALALAAASSQGHTQTLQLLLDNGAYDAKSANGHSALEEAAGYGHSEAVELLLERGANVYSQDTSFVDGALRSACDRGQKETIKVLLSKGVDMYDTSHVWTLFVVYARLGPLEIARTLLEEAYVALESSVPSRYGTVANFCAFFGCTYLLCFIYKNFETDIYASNPYGRTPLHLAAEGGHVETFWNLITLGADSTVLDAKGDGILCYAAVGGSLEIVNAILDKQLGSERYSIHWSPLHWACRVGRADVVQLLLEKGLRSHLITINEPEGQWSPLDVALYAGKGQMLKRLPATSRSLLGIEPGPERYPSKVTYKCDTCYGCRLVSSPNMIPDFVNIKVAMPWFMFPVYHMLAISSPQ